MNLCLGQFMLLTVYFTRVSENKEVEAQLCFFHVALQF